MADSVFNADALLDASYDESPPDHYTPITEGEYLLRVKTVNLRQGQSSDQRVFTILDLDMVVEDEKIKADLNMPEPMVRHSIFLDMKPDGTLDFGTNKNVKLGQFKKACGLREGKKWTFRHFDGATCYGKLKQEPDKNDPERIYNRVTAVTREPSAKAA